MNLIDTEIIRNHGLSKPFASESFPFDDTTLVLKVNDKIFLLLNLEPPLTMSVKCDPELAIELREQYDFVEPGYHMNKKHWNTIRLDQPVPINELFSWIDHSYDLVLSGLPKKTHTNANKNTSNKKRRTT